LNRLPEVKKFIYEDIPMFHNVVFKAVPGADPKLVLLNKLDQVVESIDLAKLKRRECNSLLVKKGFYLKKTLGEEVPEEHKEGPYGSGHEEL